MITAIYKDDVKKFMDLAPDAEWKSMLTRGGHAIGSITKVEDGYAPAGVLIYEIQNKAEITGWQPFLYVRWVYASIISRDAVPVYKELFGELEDVSKRLKAYLITMDIPLLDNYNYRELAQFLEDTGYILMSGRDDEMYALRFPELETF